MNALGFFRAAIFGSDRSPEWYNVRKKHLAEQPFCQGCGSKNNLEVHHIEPFHVNPSRELDPSNLITLCGKNCHFIFGHLMDYSSWNTNVIEDCRVYLDKVKSRPYKIKVSSNTSHTYNIFYNLYKKLL
jgi:5-methylcytosine-specific restriction protein A